MKYTKRILAILLAAIFVVSLSACEITRENNNSTENNSSGYDDAAEYEGDDISDMLHGEGSDFQLWYSDNGDIYAFNSAGQYYLKNAEGVFYGAYKFTTSTSNIYYGLLSIISDNDSSKDETFNVKIDNADFILSRASNPDDVVRITKTAPGEEATTDSTENIETTEAADGETVAEGETAAETVAETEAAGDASGNIDVFEIMGLKVYYLTMVELVEGGVSELTVNASPATAVQAEDGSMKYEHDDANVSEIIITENSNIYMPDVAAPSSETYGCDIYQMRDCLDTFGGFYAAIIMDGEGVESVQYYHVAE